MQSQAPVNPLAGGVHEQGVANHCGFVCLNHLGVGQAGLRQRALDSLGHRHKVGVFALKVRVGFVFRSCSEFGLRFG